MDSTVDQKDDNIQDRAVDSSSAAGQDNSANPPTGENPGAAKPDENRVPQSRFSEVVQERNREREMREMYENRIRELESRPAVPAQRESVIDTQVKRLVSKLGMDENAARELVMSHHEIASAERAKVEARQSQFQAEEWARNKAQNDPDYRNIEPELDKEFSLKSPQMQQAIASNREMLEMFYDSVKSKHATGKAKEAFGKGADEAYKSKQLKEAISSVPGKSSGSATQAISRDLLRKMSPEEYMKRQPEINAWLRNGAK